MRVLFLKTLSPRNIQVSKYAVFHCYKQSLKQLLPLPIHPSIHHSIKPPDFFCRNYFHSNFHLIYYLIANVQLPSPFLINYMILFLPICSTFFLLIENSIRLHNSYFYLYLYLYLLISIFSFCIKFPHIFWR